VPEAERYVREGQRAVSAQVATYPLSALLVAGAVGFGLAWLLFSPRPERTGTRVPDYARRRA
jgi:hypothetical protein